MGLQGPRPIETLDMEGTTLSTLIVYILECCSTIREAISVYLEVWLVATLQYGWKS